MLLLFSAELLLENGFGDRLNFVPRNRFGRQVEAFTGLLGDDLLDVVIFSGERLE